MKLIIAEKPSVAQTIAKVVGATNKGEGYLEGNGYMVSWCYGHLLTNAQPDAYDPALKKWSFETLPIVPDKWIDVPVETGLSRKQLGILTKLIKSKEVTSIVEATDAGREGELIFRRVYEYSGTKKPFERLWISSLEAQSIADGMRHLKPGSDYDNLYEAALARSRADWLFGINGTRFYTLSRCMGDDKATVGRVQTPTLAMIVARDEEIKNFVVTKRFAVQADFGEWRAETEKFEDEKKAQGCLAAVKGKPYTVESVETQKKSTAAPKLFSLTSLQREMNSKAGFSAQTTLNIIQGLYEKKILSYPRTDAEYITSDMQESFTSIVRTLMKKSGVPDNQPLNFKKVVNNDKVSDHYAIILTQAYARQCEELELSDAEEKIVKTVKRRMIEAVHPSCSYNEIKVMLDNGGWKFTSTGNEILDPGWRAVAKSIVIAEASDGGKKDDKESKQNIVPTGIKKGDTFKTDKAAVVNRDTKPPQHYTEATLLQAMERAGVKDMDKEVERKGLGTSATRAEIIEKLLNRKYIVREKKSLLSTEAGRHLIASVSDGFKSVDTTVDWENRLLDIEKGKGSEDCSRFCLSIENKVREIISDVSRDIAMKASPAGPCPWCGNEMELLGGKATCKTCGKKIWMHQLWMPENIALNPAGLVAALNGQSIRTTMKAKTGKTYPVNASIDFEKTRSAPYAAWKFEFINTKNFSSSSHSGGHSSKH